MVRLPAFCRKRHGSPRVDDWHVLFWVIFINRKGLPWRDAPGDHGRSKTRGNRCRQWSLDPQDEGLAFVASVPKTGMTPSP
ncbi:hypothetical protein [Pararhodobacter sp.]|uniref:hypothetical protein n=1 Tax=Pararhodobacter sp. TaxID=2127056 RepID=UPI002AFE74A2|nr:hypothetical protein [Pararhodobacter sp.]